jgi:hypothetical protein
MLLAYTLIMTPKSTPQSVLQQIAEIQKIEKGTISVIREGPKGAYYNHQCYENGKNVSRYVPRDQVDEFKEGIEGYQRFQTLVEEYVHLMVEKTRAERSGVSKKNSRSSAGSKSGD